MYTYVIFDLINRCLLNFVINMTKTLIGHNYYRQNIHSTTFECYLENHASIHGSFTLSLILFLCHTLQDFT